MDQIKTILVGIDFSKCSINAFHQAVRIAQKNGAALHVLHVVETVVVDELAEALYPTVKEIHKEVRRHLHAKLENLLPNDSDENRQKNRRVEILVTPY